MLDFNYRVAQKLPFAHLVALARFPYVAGHKIRHLAIIKSYHKQFGKD